MEMKKYIHKWYCMLLTLLGFACGSVPYKNWEQQEFIDHWKKVRTTITEKNLEGYLLLSAQDPEQINQGGFEELIEFDFYPFLEWKEVELIKFEKSDTEAILVLRLHYAGSREEMITLASYKFILMESGWKILPKFYSFSFNVLDDTPEKQEEAVKKGIEEKLNEEAEFQLPFPEYKESGSKELPLQID